MADHFETLGVPRSFRLDAVELEKRYRELSRLLHPDRHAAGGATARRMALEKSIAVNDAYRVLRDPARRAAHLLEQRGIDLGESGAHGAGRFLPQEFLLEVMELRETFDEARAARDFARVERLKQSVKKQRDETLDALAAAFDADDVEGAARQLSIIRYYDRFLGEVRAFEDQAFEEEHG